MVILGGQGVTTCRLRAEKTTKVVRSPNVLRYIESCGNEGDVGSLLASNLAAVTRLAAENESQAHEKTGRTYELRLMSLEKFAEENGDDDVLFGGNNPNL